MSTLYKALVGPLMERIRQAARRNAPAEQKGDTLGLALGGGFARGFAHIGALEVLEENKIPVFCVAGTSIGSILGAAYCSGLTPGRIGDICRAIRFKDFARWKISKMGLASNDRMDTLIRRWFRALKFEDMKIPLGVVATDLGTGEAVMFRSGSIVDPIRASCAFPGLFEPVLMDRKCYADGGLVAPLPTRAATMLGARRVLAIDVGFSKWSGDAPTNMFQVLYRSLNAAQKHRNPSWENFADLVISPAVQGLEWDDFERADEAIAAGRVCMTQALPRLREILHLDSLEAKKAGAGRLQHDAA